MSTVTYKGLKIRQLDVKSKFLNGPLEDEVYVSQPSGFKIKGHKQKVCILRKDYLWFEASPKGYE